MGVVSDLVREYMKRYLDRDPHTIYAHYLDSSVWDAISGRVAAPNGFMIIGELMHAGLITIAPVDEKCKTITIDGDVVPNIHPEVRSRFILQGGDGAYVRVCGNADGLVNGRPVEMKTTRRRAKIFPPSWKRRAELYAWLYDAPCILAIINVIDGSEENIVVEPPPHEKVKRMITEWLLGKYPYVTLVSL